VLLVALALALPWLVNPFYVSFATRVLIYAIAATSLNLVLGYGGMVSFGHAAFFGTGAYVAGICIAEGITSAWVGWPLAIAAGALLAALIGALSLRTKGVYFIMITLAFAQMMFYLVNSMKAYGGDEGLTLQRRAQLGTTLGINLADTTHLYLLVLALLAATIYALHRLSHSRFGRVITAIRENEVRAEAIGFAVRRYKLVCFVIGGAVCALAGALLANHGKYVNPNALHWTQSGTLLVMVILGGVGSLWGGLLGAVALLGLEELLGTVRIEWLAALAPNYQQHAQLGVGIVLLAVVLYAPQGLAGWLARWRAGPAASRERGRGGTHG
jgi:branched-chain amino acid transport system permease protein